MYLTKQFSAAVLNRVYYPETSTERVKKEYTREEVKKLAWHTLQRYEEKLIAKRGSNICK